MRAAVLEATDIVVLVVAADDGVMPQTIEAINHAKAAEVPIVVASTRSTSDNADPSRASPQLPSTTSSPRTWGGDTIVVEMSALEDSVSTTCSSSCCSLPKLEDCRLNPEGGPRASSSRRTSTTGVARSPRCS